MTSHRTGGRPYVYPRGTDVLQAQGHRRMASRMSTLTGPRCEEMHCPACARRLTGRALPGDLWLVGCILLNTSRRLQALSRCSFVDNVMPSRRTR